MSTPHRRDFVRALAFGASASALSAPAGLVADDDKAKESPKKTSTAWRPA